MTTVFIAGSISIKHLDDPVRDRIDTIIASDFDVVVGDAKGVDSMVQAYLVEAGANNVRVFCTGSRPRNNLGSWPVHSVSSTAPVGSREYFTAKDVEMARFADFGLMIWDCKSKGTLKNVLELQNRSKKSVVFVAPEGRFVNVVDRNSVDLLTSMAASFQSDPPKKPRGRHKSASSLQTTMDV